jgi:hypothetical protein
LVVCARVVEARAARAMVVVVVRMMTVIRFLIVRR